MADGKRNIWSWLGVTYVCWNPALWRLDQEGGLRANLGYIANAGRLGEEGNKEGRLLRQGREGSDSGEEIRNEPVMRSMMFR